MCMLEESWGIRIMNLYDKIEKKYYKETGLVESSEDYNRTKISKTTYKKAVQKAAFSKNVSKHLNNSSNRDKYLK